LDSAAQIPVEEEVDLDFIVQILLSIADDGELGVFQTDVSMPGDGMDQTNLATTEIIILISEGITVGIFQVGRTGIERLAD